MCAAELLKDWMGLTGHLPHLYRQSDDHQLCQLFLKTAVLRSGKLV